MITSYAQNFEDVMLWRALKHVPNGCYVDVGAQHPVIDSVSRLFYEQGWRGMHVEPVPEYAQLLRQDRPDEQVLQVALSDTDGVIDLNVIDGTGLSTVVADHAARHMRGKTYTHQKIQVPCQTLGSALSSLEGKEVHWLKIDVEGFEEHVLRGWDSKVLRPWVLVVEATIPGSIEVNYSGWDKIVIDAGYTFVYFDGLNRFYVANEHSELVQSFAVPPNVFDGFSLSGLSSSSLCRLMNAKLEENEKKLAKMKLFISIVGYLKQLKLLCRWGGARSLHWLRRCIRCILSKALQTIALAAHVAKKIAKKIVRVLIGCVINIPFLNQLALKVLNMLPGIKNRLKTLYTKSGYSIHRRKKPSIVLFGKFSRTAAHFMLYQLRIRTPRLFERMSRSTTLRAIYRGIVSCSKEPLLADSKIPSFVRQTCIVNVRSASTRTGEGMDSVCGSLSHAIGMWPLGGRV